MTSPQEDPDHVLHTWHDAVNAGDVDAALACCAEDVAVTGPRGTGHGRDLMRRWLERSGIRLVPQEDLVEQDGRYVVRELAHWTTEGAPDAAPREPTETWCVFTVSRGLLAGVARYESRDDIPAP